MYGTPSRARAFDGRGWTTYDTSKSGLANNTVLAIAENGAGKLWFGTNLGVSVNDGKKSWTTYDTINSGLDHSLVHGIAIDLTAGSGSVRWVASALSFRPHIGIHQLVSSCPDGGHAHVPSTYSSHSEATREELAPDPDPGALRPLPSLQRPVFDTTV